MIYNHQQPLPKETLIGWVRALFSGNIGNRFDIEDTERNIDAEDGQLDGTALGEML